MIKELHEIQVEEGLGLRNKLRCAHIRRAKQKMNVDLTAQTISARVTDANEFCDHVFKIPAFHDSAPTVKFIIMFDHLFDLKLTKYPRKVFQEPTARVQQKRHGRYFWKKQCNTSVV